MTLKTAFVVEVTDEHAFFNLKHLIEENPGTLRIVYCTKSPYKRFYIVDEDRMGGIP